MKSSILLFVMLAIPSSFASDELSDYTFEFADQKIRFNEHYPPIAMFLNTGVAAKVVIDEVADGVTWCAKIPTAKLSICFAGDFLKAKVVFDRKNDDINFYGEAYSRKLKVTKNPENTEKVNITPLPITSGSYDVSSPLWNNEKAMIEIDTENSLLRVTRGKDKYSLPLSVSSNVYDYLGYPNGLHCLNSLGLSEILDLSGGVYVCQSYTSGRLNLYADPNRVVQAEGAVESHDGTAYLSSNKAERVSPMQYPYAVKPAQQ